jgi:hypothetical protein
MAQNPDEIRRSLDRYLGPDFRGRLRAKGIARGMVWRDGVVPEGSPSFVDTLSADLLDFGYAVLVLALELRDANLTRAEGRFETKDALVVAAEAIESAVRRGNPSDGDQGRHLVVGAAAFHLAGYAARSYSMLPPSALDKNLASSERALAFLLRRDLLALHELILSWLGRAEYSDEAVALRLADAGDEFGPEDAVVLALTTTYFRALGLADTALLTGERARYEAAIAALAKLIAAAGDVGNVPIWWVATLTIHLLRDLWDQCLHVQLPDGGGPSGDLPNRWADLRRDFIAQLAVRRPPHIDLWPSQLEAAQRSVDTTDDLVIALPTSAGKTKIAELCILRTLADEKRVVYVTPLRALSAQVERVLARTFVPLGTAVTSLYGAIGASSVDSQTLMDANVVVATPEKLDFALRQDVHVLDDVGLVVFDEGHMIGLGSREIRYEVLIQRLLRRGDAGKRRIVCLSAMFNPQDAYFKDFAAWLRNDADGEPIHVEWRPTRRRLALLDWFAQSGTARLSFLEGEEAYVPRFVEQQSPQGRRRRRFPAEEIEFCLAAANAFARDGNAVLIYSPQRSQIDPLVREFTQVRKQGYLSDIKAPDPAELATALAIGREWLGKNHPAVEALKLGVGTHHGALPRPFQSAIEELLERKLLPVVVASPTLAQGVDLSCSVLVFRSLTRFDPEKTQQASISAAEFSNVVGRAGRAYVDLDGIVVLPSFEAGNARVTRHRQFEQLIKDSQAQRLISGLVQLVNELTVRISRKLGGDAANLLEYVVNNNLWSDKRLASPENLDEDDDQRLRSLDEYVADLDLAILSLVDPLDTPVEHLPTALDEILKDSLWKRTLDHLNAEAQSLQRGVIVSRARWLWSKTTVEQRRACFSAGLGARVGTFIFDQIDELTDIMIDLQAAVLKADATEAAALALNLAERVTADPHFSVRKPPDNWREVLTKWVIGTAFSEILEGLGTREEQRTQTFVQDGVVFRLVWAAEAVRVQALSSGHARASEIGDAPMLALTHGVPSIPAALLCQAGYASRTGAVWVTTKLTANFTTLDAMREWIKENEPVLEEQNFWEHDDHRLLWGRLATPDIGEYPRQWNRRTSEATPRWRTRAPAKGSFVRLIARSDRSALVCDESLEPLGELDLRFNPRGAVLEAEVLEGGKLGIKYYGPN